MKAQALLLIAEDDPDDQFFLREALEVVSPRDVETYFAEDGSQLLNFLREKNTDIYRRRLIVLDLNMQNKDGRAALREIKGDPSLEDIPVVVLTTSDNKEDVHFCKELGAAGYYRKPSSVRDLVEIIRTLYREYLN